MRRSLILLLPFVAAACSPSAQQPLSQAQLMAMSSNNGVDLRSADAAMFLQSPSTGYMETAPSEGMPVASGPASAARRGSLFGGTGAGRRLSAQEVAQSRMRRQQMASRSRDLPEITVRPPRDDIAPGGTKSLRQAFEAAYEDNPSINRARSNLRAADEGIAVARSGNRPTVTANVDAGVQSVRNVNVATADFDSANVTDRSTPTSLSLQLSQPLFQGFRTRNATREAEATVMAERQRLRATEQEILLRVAIAFTDVRRAREGVRLREQEVSFLDEQVSAARSRLEFGEGTRTDIDQAEARLAETLALLSEERSSAASAAARFRELTGLAPEQLKDDVSVTSLLPKNLGSALSRAQDNNPAIHLAIHESDAANYGVKQLEGQALPRLSVDGQVRTDIDVDSADRNESAQVRLVLQVPIYQGGRVSAQVRQAKETAGSARIAVDLARDETRTDLVTAWATYTTSRDTITAAKSSVRAASRAVNGVLEELRVGQRTTLDVLNAQRDLIRAQLTMVEAIRQRDAAGFAILSATGDLSIGMFGLNVLPYDPRQHYAAVKDKWSGMRTPDGR
ncbi:TolC family outer membrane protein [Acuticoccus sp. MNP-M23]|uniref:TolC family outer membrane protein n=1 Tax=Acuticoccus sp. MNP-M23 TaxID=3072793 RepID=UPI00281659FC|nr:TolC family outer membrane protein [Acuticoccus sp. MNP-M23]WMS41454.1 TolC family outer membrane protein [Acuticoccus sp. MNP-M23]